MWGHSQTGFVLPGDTTTRLLASVANCGSIPLSNAFEVAPLDWSGAAIVEVIASRDWTSKLWFPTPTDTCVPMHSILRGLIGAGINVVPYVGTWNDWATSKQVRSSPVAPVLHEIESTGRFGADATFQRKLRDILVKANIAMPPSRVTAHHVTLATRYLKLQQVIEGMCLMGFSPASIGARTQSILTFPHRRVALLLQDVML